MNDYSNAGAATPRYLTRRPEDESTATTTTPPELDKEVLL